VALELLVGFGLAMLVAKHFRGRRLYITIFLVPMMVVPVVVGYNFSMIYLDSGPLNQILLPLTSLLGIEPRIRWLSHPIAAQWGIIMADVWQWTSLTFLIFLSGFSALPPQLVNAARVMGATRWQIFRRVQLPLLKPVIVIAVVIRSMEALKIFDQSVLLTFGGPGNSTQTVAFYLWRQVWQFNKFSFGAAASMLLLVMFAVLIYGGIYLLVRQRSAVLRETHA
jgi:multiple sugar transport system permease protein